MLNVSQNLTRSKSFIAQLITQPKKRIKVEMTLLLLLCMVLLITVSWEEIAHNQLTTWVETESTAYLDDTMEKGGTAFLISRALNGTISVVQSFTITPFIGELSLGEVLDPVNDVVERFSWIMLTAVVSIGIQKLLMEIGVAVDLTWVILPALLLLFTSLLMTTKSSKHHLRINAYRLLLFVLLVRFAIPITGLLGSYISTNFLVEKRDESIQSIEKAQEKISEFSVQDVATSPKETLEELQKESEQIVAQIIKLSTLFLFETILFPILVLWGLMKLFGMLFHWPVSMKSEPDT
ncbi:conserved hypothetical protein, membrane [Beggiatoa sp. PS]|nr:conserved hypothetical protein, membrane [Beggiatoa sp. PS]